MAIWDYENIFSSDGAGGYIQSLIQAVGTGTMTNDIDLTSANLDAGEPVLCVVQITTAVVAAGGASTVTFQLYTDSASDYSSEVIAVQSAAIPKATLVAGYQIAMALPANIQRYNRLKWTVATNNVTAGAAQAGLVLDRQAGLVAA